MRDWNVVATARARKFAQAKALLRRFGDVDRTGYANVLVMYVPDPRELLDSLHDWLAAHSAQSDILGHLAPFSEVFNFSSPAEFEEKSREAALRFAGFLAGKRFHVRMHRRGFKGRLHSVNEEQSLDHTLLEALERAGTPGRISFDDPDAVVALETVDNRGGLACWNRDELQRYPLLHAD